MDKQKIVEFLNKNGITEVEEIKYREDVFVARLYYDFDDDEIEAASSYADDESEDEEGGEIWYEEFFLPYLNDIAIDNMGDIFEDCMESLDIGIQYMGYDVDEDQYDFSEIIAVFYDKDKPVEIERVLDDLKL